MKKSALQSIGIVLILSAYVHAEEILPGEYKTGYLRPGESHSYTFEANAGDAVSILMGIVEDYGDFIDPQIDLIEPDGSFTSTYSVGSATIDAQPIEESGTCTIIARARSGTATGTYGLSMIKNPGTDVNDPEDDPVPIRPGEYKTGYIAEGDLDGYTFCANAGDSVSILIGVVEDYGKFVDPQIDLIEPDGSLTSTYSVGSASIDAQPIEQSGICTIIARARNGTATGTYGLSMIKNPGTDVNDPEDDPVPIRPGEYKTGYIAEGDLDGYTFYANAGDFVSILMGVVEDYGGFVDPQIDLIEPDGSHTSTYSVGSASIDVQTIEHSGTCTIIARARNGNATGTYGLSMTQGHIAGTPTIDSLSDEPDPVYSTGTLTLTALGVSDPDGWIVEVDFYRDLNSNGYLDLHGPDQLLGSDSDVQDGWSWSGSIGDSPPFGLNTYFARAKDNSDLWSDPASTTGEILASIPGDINHDGLVNCDDVEILIDNFGATGCSEPTWCNGADLNQDGVVDMDDMEIIVNNWIDDAND